MILCVDCGNTSIKFALFKEGKIYRKFQIRTDRNRSSDEYGFSIASLIGKNVEIKTAIISSVVPLLTPALFKAIKKVFGIDALIVGKELKTKMPIKIDNPNELGADMLCGAIGAKNMYGNSILVADLGTATKIYVVDKNGSFIGGAITTGMEISIKALVNSTSQLLETPIILPKKVIGKNTKDCIESGVVYGQAFMIKKIADEMENECGYKLTRVLTGGYSQIIRNELNEFNFDEDLVVKGLYYIALLNEDKKYE